MSDFWNRRWVLKGLAATLLGSSSVRGETNSKKVVFIPRERLFVDEFRPWKREDLRLLLEDIKKRGIIRSLLCIRRRDDRYFVVDGERRLLVARILDIKTLPCMVAVAIHD